MNKPLTDLFRPRHLAEVIGQPAACRAVAGKLRMRCSFAVIACGQPGLGKTSLGYAIAGELGIDTDDPMSGFRIVPSNRQGVEALDELFNGCHCRPATGGWHVLLLEESECKSRQAVAYLKTRLERLPAKTVVIFTTNAELKDFTEPAIIERCLCLTFESDAGALWTDAEALVKRVWETTLGRNHAPSLDELGIASTGRLSFRQVLNALEPILQAELPPEPEQEPSLPTEPSKTTRHDDRPEAIAAASHREDDEKMGFTKKDVAAMIAARPSLAGDDPILQKMLPRPVELTVWVEPVSAPKWTPTIGERVIAKKFRYGMHNELVTGPAKEIRADGMIKAGGFWFEASQLEPVPVGVAA
jgi:hypothetical protein